MSQASKSVGEFSNLVLVIVLYDLVIGSILGADAFSSITIINVTALQNTYGSAVTAVIGFLTVVGTIVGLLLLAKPIKNLMSKKSGITNMTA